MKVYVACSWDNREFAKEVMALICKNGHTITRDWTEKEFDIHESGHDDEAFECALEDYEAVKNCDCLVFIDDGIDSPGKHVELGIATGFKRNVIILDIRKEQVCLCIFIRGNMYPIVKSKEELISKLEMLYELDEG